MTRIRAASAACCLRQTIIPLVVYVFFIAAVVPRAVALPVQAAFVGYALFVFWVIWSAAGTLADGERARDDTRYARWALIGSVCFLALTRFLPFIRYGETPLGYDTGFYIPTVMNAAADVAAGHRFVRALLWAPMGWLGLSPEFILHGVYILTQFLIAGALYVLARTLGGRQRLAYAAGVVFLFAVSVPQFFAYWWMFYQTEVAVVFLLLTLAFLHRRSVLVIPAGVFGAAIHPATFLPFGVAAAVFAGIRTLYAIVRRSFCDREIWFLLLIGIGALVFIRENGSEFMLVYLRGSVNRFGWFITNYPMEVRDQFTGLYINASVFQHANAFLFPFAGVGFIGLLWNRWPHVSRIVRARFLFLAIFALTLIGAVYMQLLYQHRYLIYLDLVLIFFAVHPFITFIRSLRADRIGRWVVALLLFGFVMFGGMAAWKQKPELYQDELQELRALAISAEPDAYVMATESLYTPWVSAYAKRATLEPGYLRISTWSYQVWQEFWIGKSNARRHELLQEYRRPIYLFVGRWVSEQMPYARFIRTDPYFVQVSQHVWRYDPKSVPEGTVAAMRAAEQGVVP